MCVCICEVPRDLYTDINIDKIDIYIHTECILYVHALYWIYTIVHPICSVSLENPKYTIPLPNSI